MSETTTEARMSLKSVSRGKVERPHRMVVYGLDGVGKSTLAAGAPSPIFIGPEMGTAQLDIARFPQPESFQDALDAIRELATGEHDFKTAVVDTLDWLEPLAGKQLAKDAGVDSIEDNKVFGFGAGDRLVAELFRTLFQYLERLQDRRGMHVILLAHGQIKKFQNPIGEDFDRWELALGKKVAAVVRQWPDDVLFANFEDLTNKKDKERVKGVGAGRLLYTTRTAAYDAKNRHGLPSEMDLDWDTLEQFLNSSNADTKKD